MPKSFNKIALRLLPILLLLLVLADNIGFVDGAEMKEELQKVGDKMGDAVNELSEVKGGELWCPVPAVGTKCPSSSPFHYYRCCGQLNNECCIRLQTWAFVVLVGIGVVIAALILLSVLRCIFCRRNN